MAEIKYKMEADYLERLDVLHQAAEDLTSKGVTKGDLVDDLTQALKDLDQRRVHLAATFNLKLPSPWGPGTTLKQ